MKVKAALVKALIKHGGNLMCFTKSKKKKEKKCNKATLNFTFKFKSYINDGK